MKYCKIGLLLLVGLGLLLDVSAQTVPGFALPDQFGNLRHCDFTNAPVTVVTVADRKGSEQVHGWVEAVKTRCAKAKIEGLADVSGVPDLFRSLVRNRIKSAYQYPIMLDWNGAIITQFHPSKGVANIFVINRKGEICAAAHGPVDANLTRVIDAIEQTQQAAEESRGVNAPAILLAQPKSYANGRAAWLV
jgi:hypothetical protein